MSSWKSAAIRVARCGPALLEQLVGRGAGDSKHLPRAVHRPVVPIVRWGDEG